MKRILSMILVTALMLGLMAPLAQAAIIPKSNITIESSTVTTLTPEQSIRLAAMKAAAQARDVAEAEAPPTAEQPAEDMENGETDFPPELPPEDGDAPSEPPLPEQPEPEVEPDTDAPQETEDGAEQPEPPGTDTDAEAMKLTRAQAAMILARMTNNTPELPVASPFTDVVLEHWAAAAIIWADASGLMIGYGDGRFGPNDILTREQFALIIYRVSGTQEMAEGNLDRFHDDAFVSDWARDAMEWAVSHALLLGDDSHKLRPRDGITRTETAAILERWLGSAK